MPEAAALGRRLAWAATAVLLLAAPSLASAAPPPAYQVREWSAEWPRFEDTFDTPGLGDLYQPICGTISGSDASNGRIRLRGPQEPCGGVVLRPYLLLAGQASVRASFVAQSFPAYTAAGIEIRTGDAAHRASVFLSRGPQAGFADAVAVGFSDSVAFAGRAVLAEQPGSFLSPRPRVELELELVPQPAGTTVRAVARYRVCPSAGCAPDAPFAEVPLVTPRTGVGLLPSNEHLGVFFVGRGESSFSVDLQDWSYEAGFHEDFLGPGYSDALPYVTDCVLAHFTGELLEVVAPETCKDGGIGVTLYGPGTPATRARFAFGVPPRCGASVGVAFGGSEGDPFAEDAVLLLVARGDFPGVGSDALVALLTAESESGGVQKLIPIGIHVLAADAGAFVAPPDGEIELRLSTVPGAEGLVEPLGEVRLCDASPCGSEAETPFQPLVPYALPVDFRSPCLELDGSLTTPDGGALVQPAPLGPVLYFAPEPGSPLLAGAAASGLGALAWRRRRGRVARSA